MTIHIPEAGAPTVLAKGFGKALVERRFTYRNGETKNFYAWSYLGRPGSIVLPVTKARKVLLVTQFREGVNGIITEGPGGTPKGDETPEQAARRELIEETGHEAGSIRNLVARPWTLPSSLDVRFHYFLATDCVKVAEPQNTIDEHTEVIEESIDDFYHKIVSGQILDGPTIALAMLALPYLGGRVAF